MRGRSISAARALALAAVVATPALADPPSVIRIGAESSTPAPAANQNERFRAVMDRVFGPGTWRVTSGYRSSAEEDRLRLEGAGTVPVGAISRHSMGTPEAPGAYDAVVHGVSPAVAAWRLRTSKEAGIGRVLVEGAHGREGPHLHIEVGDGLGASVAPTSAAAAQAACDSIYERVIDGARNPLLARC